MPKKERDLEALLGPTVEALGCRIWGIEYFGHEATLDIIKNSLRTGEKIQLVGFGSFQVKAKRARKGRNPQTGSEITITARKVLKFKPGKALHQTVNVES